MSTVAIADIKHKKRIESYQRSEDEGKSYNFGQFDWELVQIYDYEKRKRIIAFPHITYHVKYLYMILKSFLIDNKAWCYPDKSTLAAHMGCSEKSIDRYLEDACKFELIKILHFKFGSRIKNVYVVNRIDKIKTTENVLFYGENQPDFFKPSTIEPEFTVQKIIEYFENMTKYKYKYAGEKVFSQKKDIQRGENGRFASHGKFDGGEKRVEPAVDPHGQIDGGEITKDPVDNSHGKFDGGAMDKSTVVPPSNLPYKNNESDIDVNDRERDCSEKPYKIIHKMKYQANYYIFCSDRMIRSGDRQWPFEFIIKEFPEEHPVRIKSESLWKT